jgi:putative transposase
MMFERALVLSTRHAREVIDAWREEYALQEVRLEDNGERPHSSLGYLTPNRFAENFLIADFLSIPV